MKRLVPNVLTALSLLLCVAVTVLWVRSHRTMDIVHVRTRERFYFVSTYRGTFWLGAWLRSEHDPQSLDTGHEVYPAPKHDAIWDSYRRAGHRHLLGFHYLSPEPGGLLSAWVLVVPMWFPLTLAAAAPAARVVKRLRRGRRRRAGACPTCAYDLTANVSGVCPECGTPTQGGTIGDRRRVPAEK